MNTVLKINVQELDNKFLENLKKEYSDSELEIIVHDQLEPVPSFTDNEFWQMIDLLDWSEEGNDEKTVEPLVSALEQMPRTQNTDLAPAPNYSTPQPHHLPHPYPPFYSN